MQSDSIYMVSIIESHDSSHVFYQDNGALYKYVSRKRENLHTSSLLNSVKLSTLKTILQCDTSHWFLYFPRSFKCFQCENVIRDCNNGH